MINRNLSDEELMKAATSFVRDERTIIRELVEELVSRLANQRDLVAGFERAEMDEKVVY
ncbi:MAG: hypothetical protein GY774_34240 [Planctomycetes bacterium]|nr:hypothetical protein [Planctomycetota bacterium]